MFHEIHRELADMPILAILEETMRIREIEIDNFKSFARPTRIPFLGGFTAISGPNGSGKSNIIDSVLFCLGLSTSRTMRAEKLTDLINNQGKRREAKVTIRFGDDDGSTIEVGRRLRENDSGYQSTYYLNGKVCTLGELHDVLSMHNVSPNGYNVVMQGDVTRIITMTPTERRKIVDEIAGVAEFDARVNQAQHELDKVNDAEDKSGLILTEIAERLVQLQSERDQALKYQTLRSERDRLESLTRLAAVWDLKQKIAGLEDVIAAALAREGGLGEALELATTELATRRAAYAELSSRIQQTGEDELLELQTRMEETKGQIERERVARSMLDAQAHELARLAARDQEALERQAEKLEALAFETTQASEREARHRADLAATAIQYQAAQAELAELYAANSEVAKQGEELRRELDLVSKQHNELWIERTRTADLATMAGEKLGGMRQGCETHAHDIKTLESEAAALQAEIADYQTSITDYESERHAIAARYAEAQGKLEGFNAELEQAREGHARAQAAFHAASEGAFGRATETVLSAGLKGVHGTLAQLGSVEEEYAHALEIAAGAKLRNLVVDDDAVAARGIELLKSQRAGRATFLPLNKLQPPRKLYPTGEEGFIGYAVNLVKFDPKYAAAFHLAFGETVVVRDMAHARPHMGRYRMVTLDGELFERSGAMTGGSDGRGSSVHFTATLQHAMDEARARLDRQATKLATHKGLMEAIAKDAEKARESLLYCQDQVRARTFELQDRTRRLQALRDALIALESQIAILEAESEGVEEKVEALHERMLELEDRQNTLELAISDIEELLDNERVATLSSQVNSFEFTVKQLESQLANCGHELKGLALEISSRTDQVAQLQEEVRRREAEASELQAKLAVGTEAIAAFEDQLHALERQREVLRERLGALQFERERKAEEVRTAERLVGDKEREIERLREGMASTREQAQSLIPQLTAMEDELWQAGIESPQTPPSEQPTEELQRSIARLERRMRELEPVNMLAIEAFDREAARQADLQEKLAKLREERLTIQERIATIALQKKTSFMKAFDQVAGNFAEIFADLAAGTGHLQLEHPDDPFAGGMIIRAQPKDKKMLRLEAMSGGEKSLTALAFLFAFQRYLPAPFYAFDEVDAALDGPNAERLAHMVKKQTSHAQCIVISHRRPMLERSDQTIGISARADGITRVLGVKWA